MIVAVAIAVPFVAVATGGDPTLSDTEETSFFIKAFPIYGFATGLCAWLCWPSRKEITWILLALLALSSLGLYLII